MAKDKTMKEIFLSLVVEKISDIVLMKTKKKLQVKNYSDSLSEPINKFLKNNLRNKLNLSFQMFRENVILWFNQNNLQSNRN